jgi:hypothetical protein
MIDPRMNAQRLRLGGALFTLALAGCSGSGSGPAPVTKVNPLQGKLQLAVGTANIFGDLGGSANGSATGLNVVATFRQVAGQQTVGASETLVNTPTISGPFALPAGMSAVPDPYGATLTAAPTASEVAGKTISGTAQPPAGTYPVTASSFGVSNGVYSSGIEPFNTTVVGGPGALPAGQPVSYAPNIVPAYDPQYAAGDPNAFVPFGGPPAFDFNGTGRGTRDGLGEPATQLGIEEGLDVFQGVVPSTGTYSLNVVVPTQAANLNIATTANLSTTALLPAIAPPATVTTDGNGGLSSIPIVFPPKVTEALVQITDFGPALSSDPNAINPASCNGSDVTPTYYTLHVTGSGTYKLAAGLGPVGVPSSTNPSICTDAQNTAYSLANVPGFTGDAGPDQFTVQVIGFDYPAYAASPIDELGNPAPTLTGSNGQADITISSAAFFPVQTGSIKGPQVLSRSSRPFRKHPARKRSNLR